MTVKEAKEVIIREIQCYEDQLECEGFLLTCEDCPAHNTRTQVKEALTIALKAINIATFDNEV